MHIIVKRENEIVQIAKCVLLGGGANSNTETVGLTGWLTSWVTS